MGQKDPRVDAFIAKSAPFARPILTEIRKRVHEACPECEETIKWGMPHFDYKGMLCMMAAFKQHCVFGFWKGSLVLGDREKGNAMGHSGRITSLKDLPPKREMTALIRKAMALNDAGVVVTRTPKKAAPLRVPAELSAALRKNKKAKAAFDAFPKSHKREYAEWIAEAKRDETRQKRLQTAIAWIAEGKSMSWKYQ